MTDTKHTPGPWEVLVAGEDDFPGIEAPDIEFSVVILGLFSRYVDDDAGIRGRTPEEMMANARLIAAAPELLEALEVLYEELSPRALRKAAAAIAKAKGESQ